MAFAKRQPGAKNEDGEWKVISESTEQDGKFFHTCGERLRCVRTIAETPFCPACEHIPIPPPPEPPFEVIHDTVSW